MRSGLGPPHCAVSRNRTSIFSADCFSLVSCREPVYPPRLFVRSIEQLYVILPLAPNCPAVPGAPSRESGRDSSHPHQHSHHNTLRSCSRQKNLLVQVLVKPENPFWNKPPSETRVGMCVQASSKGGAGATAGTPAWCHVRVCGGVCGLSQSHRAGVYQQPGGVVPGTLLPRD